MTLMISTHCSRAPLDNRVQKLRKRIVRNVREAIEQFGMIERDARWLVCLSGGKDSYTLLAVLYELKWRGLLPVEILACNLIRVNLVFPPRSFLSSGKNGRSPPHRISGHLFRGHGQSSRRQNILRPMFPPKTRAFVPHRPRRRVFSRGFGASPR